VPTYLVSATTGEGLEALTAAIESRIVKRLQRRQVRLKRHEMALVDWLYRHAGGKQQGERYFQRRDLDNGEVALDFELSDEDWGRFLAARKTIT